jgi:HrpA-like RNA helicase
MIVFSTNVAETSITIPGIKLVIDSGYCKEAYFNLEKKVNILELKMISKSSANQRAGRAGRIENGICVRLYAEQDLTEEYNKP